jgi:hypothetical protein
MLRSLEVLDPVISQQPSPPWGWSITMFHAPLIPPLDGELSMFHSPVEIDVPHILRCEPKQKSPDLRGTILAPTG